MPQAPLMQEDHISQIPALQLLQNLGYTYLTPGEADALRGGKLSNVILEGILTDWLRENNVIRTKGAEHPFTENNIITAVAELKDVIYDGLVRTNEKVYDLLCLGKSLPQTIMGDIKSYSLKYIDWEHPENNVYHVTEEFSVERTRTRDTYRPDIVLFVNGIPLGIIECKRLDLGPGKDPIEQAISQQIRNQKEDGIPRLYLYSQILMAVSKNGAKYATTGTPMEFWAVWNEKKDLDTEVSALINMPLDADKKARLLSGRFRHVRKAFIDTLEQEGGREVTSQDKAIYSLCRPERLIELTYRFVIYDAGDKKIARYQQYFCVKKITGRISDMDRDGKRPGGVVWHTQGSGKSLTMVMLAKALALSESIPNNKIILVTDRIDLDDQIYGTFRSCGKEVEQARTGKHLIKLLEGNKERIITTVIGKFDAAFGIRDVRIDNPNIFVLVDEGHRGQYGPQHAKMRKALPNACFIGFTGTPVMKKDKSTVATFGGLIDTYTIREAVDDKSVVPLLYEGRHVEQKVDSVSIDDWFEKITKDLSKEQANDLKRKFATTDQLNKAEQRVTRIGWDISEHYKNNWQGTPYKAQLVTQDKATALLYKKKLDEFGMVSSEVLISSPDKREGETDIYDENKEEVQRFWKGVIAKYGTEKVYNKQVINSFKNGDTPEIIIVVDKLITGFDAPRNTVLYITRQLKDHTLLQAIARVNRLYPGKEFGYIIDYRGILSNLDSALDLYGNLPDFDREDLRGTLTDVSVETSRLPQRHSDLWAVFETIRSKKDEEEYERLLADEAIRVEFYEKLSLYARTLSIALASVNFIEKTPKHKIEEYKGDLKFFRGLRSSVRRRYAEVIDFSEYESKIQKLINTYVGTGNVEQIIESVNIFDEERFRNEISRLGNDAAKADTIAHRTKRTIMDKFREDPAFYKKFSALLEEAIRAFREKRLQAAEYLKRVTDVMHSVVNRNSDDVPEVLKNRAVVKAYYGVMNEIFGNRGGAAQDVAVNASISIDDIIAGLRIVNWVNNSDVQNQMRNSIEDYLFELSDKYELRLTIEEIDSILEQCLDIARVRMV